MNKHPDSLVVDNIKQRFSLTISWCRKKQTWEWTWIWTLYIIEAACCGSKLNICNHLYSLQRHHFSNWWNRKNKTQFISFFTRNIADSILEMVFQLYSCAAGNNLLKSSWSAILLKQTTLLQLFLVEAKCFYFVPNYLVRKKPWTFTQECWIFLFFQTQFKKTITTDITLLCYVGKSKINQL
jgi:hypothetical protein